VAIRLRDDFLASELTQRSCCHRAGFRDDADPPASQGVRQQVRHALTMLTVTEWGRLVSNRWLGHGWIVPSRARAARVI
jgi:hypothetical protein